MDPSVGLFVSRLSRLGRLWLTSAVFFVDTWNDQQASGPTPSSNDPLQFHLFVSRPANDPFVIRSFVPSFLRSFVSLFHGEELPYRIVYRLLSCLLPLAHPPHVVFVDPFAHQILHSSSLVVWSNRIHNGCRGVTLGTSRSR